MDGFCPDGAFYGAVPALIEHLHIPGHGLYRIVRAVRTALNENIDPRFKYVVRGCAPYVEWLGIRENPQGKGWAAGAGYGEKILTAPYNILEARVYIFIHQSLRTGIGFQVLHLAPYPKLCRIKGVRTAPCMGDNVDQVVYEGIYTVTGISADKRWYRLKSGLFITADAEYVMFMRAPDLNSPPAAYIKTKK